MKKWIVLFGAIFTLGFSAKPTIVFDFGGVMIDFDRENMVSWCCDSLSIRPDQMRLTFKKFVGALAIGAIDEEAFWLRLAEENGGRFPVGWKRAFIDQTNHFSNRREEMFTLVKDLKSNGYRVALFSDVSQWQAEAFRTNGDYDLFSPVVLSCEIGARKPTPQSYAKLFELLGAEAKDCIFIDDRAENIEGAKRAGMRAILFTTQKKLQEGLLELGVE